MSISLCLCGVLDSEMEETRDSHQSDRKDWTEEALLPTLSLLNVPHPTIPNFYQRCFEYVERGQWSSETERVETGQWFFKPEPDGT